MIRLLYFTDPHIRGSNPRARIDDFPAAMKSKLREVWKLADDTSARL
jgi:exonuclease SbcD